MVKYLRVPLEEGKDAAALRVGDVVYLSGTVYTMRDSAHNRLFNDTDKGVAADFSLQKGAVWHAGPVVKKEGENWQVSAVGATTSYRFSVVTPRLLDEFGVKIIVGKGGLAPEAVAAIQRNGAVFLSAVGGCAGVYVQNVKQVQNVYWAEMGLPEAVWELKVENLGALVVTIDSTGDNLYERTIRQLGGRLDDIYAGLEIHPDFRYIYWPPSMPGIPRVAEYFKNYRP